MRIVVHFIDIFFCDHNFYIIFGEHEHKHNTSTARRAQARAQALWFVMWLCHLSCELRGSIVSSFVCAMSARISTTSASPPVSIFLIISQWFVVRCNQGGVDCFEMSSCDCFQFQVPGTFIVLAQTKQCEV